MPSDLGCPSPPSLLPRRPFGPLVINPDADSRLKPEGLQCAARGGFPEGWQVNDLAEGYKHNSV